MDTRLTKEALLRHLLDADPRVPEDKTIYSYLLGIRLFQSPEQLLHEIERRISNKDPAEVGGRFLRHNNKPSNWSKGPACTKCRQKHDAPKLMSKSTNNMLDSEPSSVYVELVRNNVMVNNVGRVAALDSLSSSDSDSLSPAISANERLNETAQSCDFDDYCDIDADLAENRRNTAPPATLEGLPSPRTNARRQAAHRGTDFATHKHTFISTANIEITLENLPETNLDEVLCADGVVASGEDTIRRRKKGRRRTIVTSTDDESPVTIVSLEQPATLTSKFASESNAADRRSVASRDSGILSEVMEHGIDVEYHGNNNNNNNKKSKTGEGGARQESTVTAPRIPSALHKTMNISVSSPPHDDSGYSSQVSPASMNGALEELSKDVEAHVCVQSSDDATATNEALARQLHLLHVLLLWVRDFPSDFRKNKAMVTLNGLLKTLKNNNQELKEHCAKVLETLSQCTTAQKNYEEKLIASDREDAAKSSEDFRKVKEDMVALVTGMSDVADASKMAEQLCLIEMDLLSHLGAEEFLQMFNSSGAEESRTNLGASVRWFNHLSHLVATTVCVCRKPKHRRHVISLFTRSAARCYELSNFNSAMAILTGLSLGAVARLKRTWSKLDTKDIEKLQSVFDPSNNFRRYRTMFKSRWAAMRSHQEVEVVKDAPVPPENRYSSASQHSVTSRMSVASVTSQHRDSGIECENDSGASSKSPESSSADSTPKRQFTFDEVSPDAGIKDGVLVPFLTLMVKDVYFLNHSTPTIEHDGTINVEKLRHLGEILHPLETWKNNPCVYQKNQDLQDFLLHSPVLKDTELYSLSYKREPPKNKFEKSQLKTIRAEIETNKRSTAIRRIILRRKTM